MASTSRRTLRSDGPAPETQIYLRPRPLSSEEERDGHRSCWQIINNNQIITIASDAHASGRQSSASSPASFHFDYVFEETARNAEVYNRTVRPLVQSTLDGYESIVFVYGKTGAGKTHTMTGSEGDCVRGSVASSDGAADGADEGEGPDYGVIQRVAVDAFAAISQHNEPTSTWKVTVSYIEIYNETACDLLRPHTTDPASFTVPLRGGVSAVNGLSCVEVTSVSALLKRVRRGNARRRTEPTALNAVSSRSHAVLQLTVHHTTTTTTDMDRTETVGTLTLVDLSGSEGTAKAKTSGLRLQEGRNINKSLLTLGRCFEVLAANATASKPTRVPFADSTLTKLLRSSLEGNGRIVVIANVNPSHVYVEDTKTTLKYATKAKLIAIQPILHATVAVRTTQQRLEEAATTVLTLQTQLADARREHQRTQGELKEARKDVESARREREEARQTTLDARHAMDKTVEAMKEQVKTMERALQWKETQLQEMGGELKTAHGERDKSQAQLHTSEDELKDTRMELTKTSSELKNKQAESCTKIEALRIQLERQATVAAGRSNEMASRLERNEELLREAHATQQQLQTDNERLRTQLTSAQAEPSPRIEQSRAPVFGSAFEAGRRRARDVTTSEATREELMHENQLLHQETVGLRARISNGYQAH